MSPPLSLIVAQAAAPESSLGFEDGSMMDGVIIAAVGLVIVYVALILISLFIAMMPRWLTVLGHLWPEVDEHHAMEHVESEAEQDLAVLAAIGFVLHTEFQHQLARAPVPKSGS